MLIQPSTFFRAGAFRRTTGFNCLNPISWDGELAVDLALAGARFGIVQDYWSCFRIHAASLTGSADRLERHERERRRIAERIRLGGLSGLERRLLWATGWLAQPTTLVQRIIDGMLHPNRLV